WSGTGVSLETVGMLYVNGWLATMQRDISAALPMLEESRILAEQSGDGDCLAYATGLSGMAVLYEGHPEKAAPLLRDAIEGHAACGDQYGITMASIVLASALYELGDAGRADALTEECLARSEDHGESWCRVWALTWLAMDIWTRGQPSASEFMNQFRSETPISRG
ncbi:hypothetical protein ACTMTI_53770, partial [Nonomuraea sp. H19]